jgi:hypothetical protein
MTSRPWSVRIENCVGQIQCGQSDDVTLVLVMVGALQPVDQDLTKTTTLARRVAAEKRPWEFTEI